LLDNGSSHEEEGRTLRISGLNEVVMRDEVKWKGVRYERKRTDERKLFGSGKRFVTSCGDIWVKKNESSHKDTSEDWGNYERKC